MSAFQLCASQIDSVRKINRLRNMLTSYRCGDTAMPLVLSLACSDATLAQITRKMLKDEKAKLDDPGLLLHHIVIGKFGPLEHYKCIVEELPEGAWVCFTGDDDLHHPQRARSLMELMSASMAQGLQYCAFTTHVDGRMGDVDEDLATVKAVNAIVNDDASRVVTHDPVGELWKLAMPAATLRCFLDQVTPEVLTHPLGDSFLVKYVSTGGKYGKGESADPAAWGYYYRRNNTAALEPAGSDRLSKLASAINGTHTSSDVFTTTFTFAAVMLLDPEVQYVCSKVAAFTPEAVEVVRRRVNTAVLTELAEGLMRHSKVPMTDDVLQALRGFDVSKTVDAFFVQHIELWQEEPYIKALLSSPRQA